MGLGGVITPDEAACKCAEFIPPAVTPHVPPTDDLGRYRFKASGRVATLRGALDCGRLVEVEFDDGARAQMTPAELASDTVEVKE